MKKKDLILIVSVLIIIVGSILANKVIHSSKGELVEIYLDNKLYKKVPLDKEQKIEIKNKKDKNTVYIHDRGVEVSHANCHDKVCVKTGFIKNSGDSIVCLPHKLNIKIVASDKNKKEQDVIAK